MNTDVEHGAPYFIINTLYTTGYRHYDTLLGITGTFTAAQSIIVKMPVL
jgi:hypothetical protein